MATTPFHSRAEIGLRPPRAGYSPIQPQGITAHWEGVVAHAWPWDHARCASLWRAIQAFHMDARGFNDVAYTSAACPHGHRYEGRPATAKTGANGTADGNRRSLATCYIAGIHTASQTTTPLTQEGMAALYDEQERLGLEFGWCHRDWKPTACPGTAVCAWVRAGALSPAPVVVPDAPIVIPPPLPIVLPEVDDVTPIDFAVRIPAGQSYGWRALDRPHHDVMAVSMLTGDPNVPGTGTHVPNVGIARHHDGNTIVVIDDAPYSGDWWCRILMRA